MPEMTEPSPGKRDLDKALQVSVICTTYNHERYIRQCLDSILSQETTFQFEVIVHDDASTDGTIEIIRDYARKYSDKIIPIIEEENCHQRGVSFLNTIKQRVRGKYVALCECDDWWTDNQKLQRQWTYMEAHPECSLHVHAVKKYDEGKGKYSGKISPANIERDYSTDDVVVGDGGMFGTNSMFFRSDNYPRPQEYFGWGVGDYPTVIYLSTVGAVHFDSQVMSAYRVGAVGSWTERMTNSSYAIACREKLAVSLRAWDQMTGGIHHTAVEKRIVLWTMDNVVERGSWAEVSKGAAREAYRSLSSAEKLKFRLKIKHPKLFRTLQQLKNLVG